MAEPIAVEPDVNLGATPDLELEEGFVELESLALPFGPALAEGIGQMGPRKSAARMDGGLIPTGRREAPCGVRQAVGCLAHSGRRFDGGCRDGNWNHRSLWRYHRAAAPRNPYGELGATVSRPLGRGDAPGRLLRSPVARNLSRAIQAGRQFGSLGLARDRAGLVVGLILARPCGR